MYLDEIGAMGQCKAVNNDGKSPPENVDRETRAHLNAFLEKNRGRPQYRHAPRAGVAANKILRPLAKKFGPGVTTLKSQWPEIVGAKWAALSRPVKISGGKGDKSLLIEAKGPAAALISANSGQLLAKINQFLGAESLQKIKVKQGFKTAVKAAPQTKQHTELHESIELESENTLEDALNKLGKKLDQRAAQKKINAGIS